MLICTIIIKSFARNAAQAMLKDVVVAFVRVLAWSLWKFHMLRQCMLLLQASMRLVWGSLICALRHSLLLLLSQYISLRHGLRRIKHSILTSLVMQRSSKLLHLISANISVKHAKRVMNIALLRRYLRFMSTWFSDLAFFKTVVC